MYRAIKILKSDCKGPNELKCDPLTQKSGAVFREKL